MQTNEVEPLPHTIYKKITSKGIKDLNVRARTITRKHELILLILDLAIKKKKIANKEC